VAQALLVKLRMNVSLYQAAAALNANSRWQDVIADNLASSSVPGFKKQSLTTAAVQAGLLSVNSSASPQFFSVPKATVSTSFISGELDFTGDVLAGIYLGTITKWNDPAIAKFNKGVNLPATDIVVMHRSDASGTSYVWTDYLSKISPEWQSKVGRNTSVNWPVGLGGKGNEGVTGLVKQTPGAIGYVELIYAVQNQIPYGRVRNAAGVFVKADLAGVTAAAAGYAKAMPEDFRISITNAPGKAAYPIASFTYLLIPTKIEDANKKEIIKGFLAWMLNDGQKAVEALSYARLPKEVVAKELKQISQIQ